MPLIIQGISFKPEGSSGKTFDQIVNDITNFIFVIALAVAVIMIIIAAFHFLTSGGDQNKIRTAKNIFLYAIIGLLITLLAKAIVSMVKQVMGVS
jgi:cytochrome bd-type quinol oxidase subunit 2